MYHSCHVICKHKTRSLANQVFNWLQYDIFYNPETLLVNNRWSFSTLSIRSFQCGDQTEVNSFPELGEHS